MSYVVQEHNLYKLCLLCPCVLNLDNCREKAFTTKPLLLFSYWVRWVMDECHCFSIRMYSISRGCGFLKTNTELFEKVYKFQNGSKGYIIYRGHRAMLRARILMWSTPSMFSELNSIQNNNWALGFVFPGFKMHTSKMYTLLFQFQLHILRHIRFSLLVACGRGL